MNYEKYKHYDIEMEKAIVGACLLEKETLTRIFGFIEPIHFYDDKNAFLVKRMFAMWKSSLHVDLLTVTQTSNHTEWAKICKDPLGWYAATTMNSVVSTAHIETHCLLIRQLYANRKALEIQMQAGSNADGVEALMTIQAQIADVFRLRTVDDWECIDEVMVKKLINHMDRVKGKDVLGIPSGFKSLDRMLAGFQATQLIVIGARPSVGKSALAGVVALSAAKRGESVGIISLEMPNEQLGARLLSMDSGIEFWKIWRNKLDDEQFQNLMGNMSNLSQLKVYFSDHSGVNISGIKAKAEKLKKRHGLNMLIIDYLQLIGEGESKSSNREREVAKMSLGCKLLAMQLKIPVILLAQLNRGSESSTDKKPRLHNLRESGAIEQDADVVIMLHRDRVNEQEQQKLGNYGPYEASLIVEKNRNGTCGEIPISFDAEKMMFYEDQPMAAHAPPSNYRPLTPGEMGEPVKNHYEVEKDDFTTGDTGQLF